MYTLTQTARLNDIVHRLGLATCSLESTITTFRTSMSDELLRWSPKMAAAKLAA